MSRKRYRYILNTDIKPDYHISDYRLVSANQLREHDTIVTRVTIPDGMILSKYSCDNYATTEDNRTLDELNYEMMIRINGKLTVRNDLKGYDYNYEDISKHLYEQEQLYLTPKGYMDKTNKDKYLYELSMTRKNIESQAKELKELCDNKSTYEVIDRIEYADRKILIELIKLLIQ